MKIVKAKLLKRETDDKLMQVNDDIPDGKEFFVDLDVKKHMEFFNKDCKIAHKKEMVKDVCGGFLPVELLELGEEVKLSDFIKDTMLNYILENADPNKIGKT